MTIQNYQLEEARLTLCRHFPDPVLGETIFSVCARFHRLSAMKRPALTGILLLDSARAASKRCVPAGLGTLTKSLPDVFPSVSGTLQEHTHGSLYLRFMTREQQARCTAACLFPAHRRERLPFDWASARFEAQHPLRFCTTCSTLDEQHHGFAFWHLEHQLPGVLVCAAHAQPLQANETQVSRNAWLLPGGSRTTASMPISATQLAHLMCLADTVQRLCGPSRANLVSLRSCLCLQLEQAGVVRACRALNEEKLRRWLSTHISSFGGSILEQFDACAWADAVAGVLGKRLAHHPLRWALLIACLRLEGASPEPAFLALDEACQRSLPGIREPEHPTSPQMALDAVACGAAIRDISARMEVSRAVVQRWLSDPAVNEAWHLARRRNLRGKHEASIIAALSNGASTRQALKTRSSAAYQWFQRNEPAFLDGVLPPSLSQQQIPLWS